MLAARTSGRQILSVCLPSESTSSLTAIMATDSALTRVLRPVYHADPSIPNAIVSVFMLAAVLHLLADLFFLFQPPLYVLVKRLQ